MSYEYSSWTEIKLTVKVTSLDSATKMPTTPMTNGSTASNLMTDTA